MISSTVRFLRTPIVAVSQNLHPIAHPSCVDTHAARRPPGLRTISTVSTTASEGEALAATGAGSFPLPLPGTLPSRRAALWAESQDSTGPTGDTVERERAGRRVP